MEILCGIVGVVVVLFVVAAIGHGLWTLAAWLIRGADARLPLGHCPVCGKPIRRDGSFCSACGFKLGEPKRATLDADLEATKRQLNRLADSGRISRSLFNEVLEGIRRDALVRSRGSLKPDTDFGVRRPVEPQRTADKPPESTTPVETMPVIPVARAEPIELAEPVDLVERAELAEPVQPVEPTQPVEPITVAAATELPTAVSSAESTVPVRSRGLADVLHAFMEEKNIRWGELVSGLLIVGSSVGLVISLWATLKEAIPYFPVAVFVAATAAMHGAGLYTLRSWRLKATSRGLLIISTLLVPLNVLAAILLNDRKPVYEAVDYAAVTLGLAVLAAIVFSAARVLNRRNPWPMFIAVTGTAVGTSLIGRLTVPAAPELQTLLLFAMPFGSFLFGAVAQVGRLAAGRHLSTGRTAQSFRFLGIGLFSLVIAAALLAWKSGDVLGTLSQLSPVVSVLATTITAAGLVIQQRTVASRDAGFRTAGTAVALGGGLLVMAAVILAWPRPDLLIEVGLLNAVAFSMLGWFAAMPALHLFATSSFSLACLIGFHWTSGRISVASATGARLSELLLEARSAFILALLSLIADGAGSVLARTKAKLHAVGYFASAILQAGVAVAIAAFAVLNKVPDQNFATAVFLVLALRWLIAAWWIRREYASWIGAALLLAALAHGLGMNSAVAATLEARGLRPIDPWTMALLLHSTICAAYAVVARFTRGQADATEYDRALVFPLSAAAVAVAALAIPAILNVSDDRFLAHGGYAFWAAAIWFVVAIIHGAPSLAGAAQAVGTIGVVYGVIGYCRTQEWWSGSYVEPLHLNWQLSALAVWSGLWIAVRRASRGISDLSRVLKAEPTTVDRVVLGAVVVGLAGTCVAGSLPGIFAEMASVGNTPSRWIVYYVVALIPFGLAAIFTASHAIFERFWREVSVIAIGFLVVCVAILTFAPGAELWPGFPSPYGQGWGAGAWAALGLTALALVAAHWERSTKATLAGLTLTVTALPFLIACRWDEERATASALRWSWAVVALIVAILWALRGPIARLCRRLRWSASESATWTDAAYVRNAFIALSGLSILAITVQSMWCLVGTGRLTAGPLAGSFFARIGPAESDAVPLAIVAASFLFYLMAERKALWGMSATFLAQCAFGLVCCYSVALSPQRATFTDFVRFLQEMGLSAGVAAIFWLAVEQIALSRRPSPPTEGRPLRAAAFTQLVLAMIVTLLLAAGATYGLWLVPAPLWNSVQACGSPLAWSLLALVAAGWCLFRREGLPRSVLGPVVVCLAAAPPSAAASLSASNLPANWLSFHTAIAGWCALIGVAACDVVMRRIRNGRTSNLGEDLPGQDGLRASGGPLVIADWTLLLTPLIVLYIFKGEWRDPFRPWWSAGPALWLSLCTIVLAACAASRRRAYLSLGFAILGSIFIGFKPWLGFGGQPLDQDVLNLVHIVVIGMAIQALIWVTIEIDHERRGHPLAESAFLPPSQHVVALLGTVITGLPVALLAVQHIAASAPQPMLAIAAGTVLGWSAIALVALLSLASLWERGARHGLPLLYALGLITIMAYLERLDLSQQQFIIVTICSAAGYVVLTGGLWALRGVLQPIGLRLGMKLSDAEDERVHRWLSAVNLVVGVLVIITGFWLVLTFTDFDHRIAAALATLALAAGIALLATGTRRRRLQTDALVVGAIASVQIGWALMDVGPLPHEELRRSIRMMVMLAAAAFIYGVPLVRLLPAGSSWFLSIRRVAVGAACAAIVSLGLILVFEFLSFDPSAGTAVTTAESVVVAVALAGLAAGLISVALLPGRDPFLSTEKQRFLYVYGGEAVAGLLFGHLYLTNPQFFHHLLQPYWPLVVMGIAFCGAGLSELFGRLKINVLSKPVEHTAAFLPVLPLLGFWLLKPELNYSTTLIAVGLLYLFLSLRRGSFVYSAAAAIVGNATLCALFAEHGVSLLVHPQMFIIPPCATILAAAQLNRDRLSESALSTVRYFAITTIYVSSTGEMFQHGIGTTLWLPMVLAGLSVLGVLAGIALRVRAFLYLGTSFLLLSLVSMVWHASRSIGHVWPWWVFLFTLGLALLTLFGIFEKKRPEVLALIDHLRQWER